MCDAGNSPPIDDKHVRAPTFRIVQAKTQRVVLVLDVSGSMNKLTSGVSAMAMLEDVYDPLVRNQKVERSSSRKKALLYSRMFVETIYHSLPSTVSILLFCFSNLD